MAALDLKRAARNFSAAAPRYERAALLQAQTRAQLLQLLPETAPARVLDLGCGTGLGARALQLRWPQAQLLGLDLAEGMLQAARSAGVSHCVRADAQRLPLATASVDLIFANLSLQWCPQLSQALAEAARVLRSGGLLACALPAPGTLRELRLAWRQIDTAEHVHRFASPAQLRALAQAAGLLPEHELLRSHPFWHADVRELMQGLREIGAGNASAARRRGLLGRGTLAQLEAAYAPWRQEQGLRASWEIVYLLLRKPG
ncbi:malonyl-CoA O-methyltransferase [Solimonas aquatica]|uniref:Malonyl-[acyl-carrier protein] O-methyltransferase n=1 Tax=Solimonas aquatica TaxID=489703 RepID=A0A1H9BQ77_9GAMM|nr:malonyl-ACP O-methyltransferase BioC [Solimonas aquatica]SEP91096.1 malonyl-CoA O-methyltransferase [Solimonas aquatica]